MLHVFVETNWVVGYAAPAHHKLPAAVELLGRARRGEIQLHVPAFCLTEARNPLNKFQPRYEADAIRQFLAWRRETSAVDERDDQATRRVLNMFESKIKTELSQVGGLLKTIATEQGVEVYALSERMLALTQGLSLLDLSLEPFDQAVLGAVLGRVEELYEGGGSEFAFCELDHHLQPWDRVGNVKQPLASLYDERKIWVYSDFTLDKPARPEGWPGDAPA